MKSIYKSIILFVVFILIGSFTWSEELKKEYFTIEYEPSDAKFAKKIAERFPSIIAETNKNVGFYSSDRFKIIIVHSKAKFKEMIESSSRLPEKSLALAIPSQSTMIALNPPSMPAKTDYFKVLTHEYLHLLLSEVKGDIHVPLWFNEGFVQYFAGQWSFTREVEFVMRALQGKSLNLNLYNYRYPDHNSHVQTFYMQSYYTFKKLVTSYSLREVQRFLDDLSEQKDFRTYFLSFFGVSVRKFLERARESIPSHIILSVFYSGFGIIWVIIPIILIVAFIRKKYVAKRIEEEWEKMEEEEREFQVPDYEIIDNEE